MKNTKNKKKGFFMTLVALLFLLIFNYYYILYLRIKSNENSLNLKLLALDKVNYYVDDVVDDLRNLIEIDNKDNLTISENLSINKSKFFLDYLNFLSNHPSINFSLNYSDPIKVNYFGANYYSYFNGTVVFVNDSAPGVQLPFSYYEISLFSNESYVSYDEWDWRPTGTYVKINYSSQNQSNSFLKEGYVNPALENDFVIHYPSGDVTIRVGKINTNRNSFALYQNGQINYMKLVAYPEQNKKEDLYFNILLSFSILGENFSGFLPVK
ncbi:MAG: hypothetical protein QXI58_06595 [Candidatus Micrarchaeia archaeon]